eukprot:jgi/Botrbrau1/15020/Bobra.0018s0117.2
MVVLEVAQTCNRGSSCINGAAPLLSVSVAPHRACLLTQLRAERGHGLQIRAQQAAQTMSGHPDAVRRAEERRLRRETLAIELMRPDTSGPWYKGEHPSNMVEVYTVDDLEKQVQRTDCLVVVEVFVPACPGCRKLFPKIKQIASNNPDVRFVQVGPSVTLPCLPATSCLNRGLLWFKGFTCS